MKIFEVLSNPALVAGKTVGCRQSFCFVPQRHPDMADYYSMMNDEKESYNSHRNIRSRLGSFAAAPYKFNFGSKQPLNEKYKMEQTFT